MQILIQIGWKLAEIFGFEDGKAILGLVAILDLAIFESGYLLGLTKRWCMQICIQIGWKLADILVFLFEERAAIMDLAAILDLAILDSGYPLGLAKRWCMQILIQIGWNWLRYLDLRMG